MKKMRNPYKEASIFELNMMGVHHARRMNVSVSEILFTLTPLVAAGLIFTMTLLPDMQFFAECQNIPGGDVCSISMK